MLEQDRRTENKTKGRILFLIGFLFALGAYNHKFLWNYSFYHLIAFSFVFYISESWITETNKVWLVIRGFVLITALNALKDEFIGEGSFYKISEYLALTIIAIITTRRIIKLHYKK
jgi:hypothetical protein